MRSFVFVRKQYEPKRQLLNLLLLVPTQSWVLVSAAYLFRLKRYVWFILFFFRASFFVGVAESRFLSNLISERVYLAPLIFALYVVCPRLKAKTERKKSMEKRKEGRNIG